MPVYCAIAPLDQSATRIGRGFGLGYNRARTLRNQLHGGMDFVADVGTPILAVVPGTVVLKSTDASPARGMGGYGNALVLRHDFDVPGLPNPFWTSYNHMREPSRLELGQHIGTRTLIGLVGNTTNGRFAGMGAHLHFELRRRAFPGSYDNDTMDPAILFRGLGIDVVGARREVDRMVGGQLLVRTGGPSDCRAGTAPTIAGISQTPLFGYDFRRALQGALSDVPPGYVDPSTVASAYAPHGVSRSNQNVESPALQPPDYKIAASSGGGGGALAIAAVLGVWLVFGRS